MRKILFGSDDFELNNIWWERKEETKKKLNNHQHKNTKTSTRTVEHVLHMCAIIQDKYWYCVNARKMYKCARHAQQYKL
ncbi:MAG: hypothetical protein ACKPKO_50910, partial [Candidatus Fonsibacter sp.]